MSLSDVLSACVKDVLLKLHTPIPEIVGEIIYFLVNFGDAILEPTVRLLIYHSACLRSQPDISSCYNATADLEAAPGIQGLAAQYMMARRLVLGLPILVIGLFCGSWSDQFGNKLPVLVPTIGNLVGVSFYLLTTVNPGTYISLLLVGASLRGLCGRTPIITMATHSYVSEVSSESQRTGRLSILQSMNYFGYLTGSFLLGVLLDLTSYRFVFLLVLAIFSLVIPVTVVFMTDKQTDIRTISLCAPCSAGQDSDDEGVCAGGGARTLKPRPYWFSLSYVRDSLHVLAVRRTCYKRAKLWLLFVLMFITQAWKAGEIEILVLLAEGAPFSLTGGHYGYLLATESACMALSTCLLVPVLSGWFHVGDVALIIVGTMSRMLRLVIFIYARSTAVLYLGIVLGSPISIAVSGLRALISKMVHREELNRVFSLLSSVETAASLFGAFIFLSIYTQTFAQSQRVTFEVAIGVQVVLVALLGLLGFLNQRYAENYENLEEEEEDDGDSAHSVATKPTVQTTQLSTPVEQLQPQKLYNAIN